MKFIYIILFLVLPTSLFSQVTIISENFGSTGNTTLFIPVNTYTGYQHYNILTYTGTASIRNTLPSTVYAGSSGLANVFITNTPGTQITIGNINTLCYTNVLLSVGIQKNRNVSNGNELVIEYSEDGITYRPMPFTLPTGNNTSGWRSIILSDFLPSVSNLRIRFRQTGTLTQFRIDDVNISGIVYPEDTTKIELRNCSAFTWDGILYDIDSVYIFKRKTYQGCDSIIAVDFVKDEDNLGCALPVVLSSFTSECVNDKIEINWITASEINNSYFELEKFNQLINKWNTIGIIFGNGNSNREIKYNYIDYNIDFINTYRLKFVDYNGNVEYSKIIETHCNIEYVEYVYFDLYGRKINNLQPNNMYIQLKGEKAKLIFYIQK